MIPLSIFFFVLNKDKKVINYTDSATSERVLTTVEGVVNGETYFSNGTVESMKGKFQDSDIEINFNPLGEVTKINTEKGVFDYGYD